MLKNNSIWTLKDLIVEFRQEFNSNKNNAYEEILFIDDEEIEMILEKILEKHKITASVKLKKREDKGFDKVKNLHDEFYK